MATYITIRPAGTSPAEQDALDRAIDEIILSSDRAAAIVAAAFVEDYLTTALQQKLVHDQAALAEMFGSGPLGTFSAKFKLAYLIGLCSKESANCLNTIRKIRNTFAHNISISSFEEPRIRDLTNNLSVPEKYKVTLVAEENQTPIHLFSEPITTARQRFVTSCQMLLFAFIMARHVRPPALDQPII